MDADHHRRIETMCRALIAAACCDDPRDLAVRWAELEAELREHMAAEEEIILPSYAKYAPTEAQNIIDDHARIRALLTPIGVDVELHEVRTERLRRLIDALDVHALGEDAGMYTWARAHLPLLAQQQLRDRVR